jgi:arylsulfatase A-like enzyme
MRSRRALFVAVVTAVLGAIVAVSAVRFCCNGPVPDGPDIVLIVTDDQRWDSLAQMPNVSRLLVDRGVRFENGFVVNSLCCPSRASILTGEYSHSTRVYTQQSPNGGVERFDDSATMATWLHDEGYRTGLFGKYLNGYRGTVVPPGWDTWLAFEQSATHQYYVNYSVNDGGVIRRHGAGADDYSTDLLSRRADRFIRSSDSPFLLYFAPYAPHAPAIPARRDRATVGELPPLNPPNFNEDDMSDKPQWMRALPKVSRDAVDEFRRRQLESLRSVDRAVGRLVETLRETGRLHDTMIAFVSDNGIALGEHRWVRKEVPYEESIRVPYVVRYDAMVRTPHTDQSLVLNIDLAPTIAQLAGVDPDEISSVEGRSLVPLLRGSGTRWRSAFLVEHVAGRVQPDPPTFCALRTERYLYVVYETGETELYDLGTDPYELRNVASDPAEAGVIRGLEPQLETLCTPPPPGLERR